MPLFSRNSFRSGKKPLKRKSVSLSNISSLDESTYSINDLKLEAGPLTLKLGESELVFEKGQWVQGEVTTTHLHYYFGICVCHTYNLCKVTDTYSVWIRLGIKIEMLCLKYLSTTTIIILIRMINVDRVLLLMCFCSHR